LTVRIVHCSDIHLDRRFNLGDPQRSERRKNDIQENFETVVNFAINNKANLVLISGDIFDKPNPSNYAISFFVSQIKRLYDKGIETVMIGGNHDVPKMGHQALAIDILHHAGLATVFSGSNDFKEKIVTIDGDDVQIIGKSYNAKNQSENPFSNYNVTKKGKYLICIIHGSLVGLNVTPNNPMDSQYNPFGSNDIPTNIDYLALGHFHNRFDREHSGILICNPGSIEKLSWSESQDQKGFAIIELSDTNKTLTYQDLSTRNWQFKEIELNKEIENINEYILEKLEDVKNPENILRLALKGTITSDQQKTFKISELAKKTNDIFFYFSLDSKVEVEGYGRIFLGKIESPFQAFENHINSQIEKTTDVEEQEFLQQAKQLGLKYLGAQNDSQ
jgi:DNA repair exonuclease SbcCD nuclease subunit